MRSKKKEMKMKRFSPEKVEIIRVVFIVLISILLLLSCEERSLENQSLGIDLWPHKPKLIINHSNIDEETFSPVSICHYKGNLYLLANYREIFLFDRASGELFKMTPVNLSSLYNPTGLFFHKNLNLLFVANYKGNNILLFEVDPENKTLEYISEIREQSLVGPENIWVTEDGEYLATANYDGNSVSVFKFQESTYKRLWTRSVPLAHGVCIYKDKVYVSALSGKRIVQYLMKTGVEYEKFGHPGWDPAKGELLYPTGIAPLKEDKLIIADARTGYILIAQTEPLNIIQFFGGNGPTYKFLNMPYGIYTDENYVVILSTFQNRIIFLDKDSLKPVEHFSLHPDNWEYLKNTEMLKRIKPLQYSRHTYARTNYTINLLSQPYYCDLLTLTPASTGYPDIYLQALLFFNNGEYLYFFNSIFSDYGYLLFAINSSQSYYIADLDGTQIPIPVNLQVDSWEIDSELYYPSGKADMQDIHNIVSTKISRLRDIRMRKNILSPDDLYNILVADTKYERDWFIEKFRSTFASKSGKEFLSSYNYCLNTECQQEEIKRMVLRYYRTVCKEDSVSIDEILLPQLLSGIPVKLDCRSQIEED